MAIRRDFEQDIRKSERLPIYVLTSPDTLLLSEAIAKLRALSLTAAPDFNRNDFRAGECKPIEVISAAGSMPMMAPLRWVHLSDIHKLKAKDHPPFMEYLKNPSPTTVMCLSGEKLDLRTKLGKALSKANCVFQFAIPQQRDIGGWIGARAKEHGFKIDRDACALIADFIGTELGILDNALRQVASYAGPDATITCDDVETCLISSRVRIVWDLTDAIGDRNLSLASTLVRNLIDGGEDAFPILGAIAYRLRLMFRTREMLERGASPRDVKQSIKLGRDADRLIDGAKRYTVHELSHALHCAGQADIRLKSSSLSQGVVLDRLLVDIHSHGVLQG